MEIIFSITLLISIICNVKYAFYRRQIQDICRQLKFLQEHATNKRLQTTLTVPEILTLTELLNDIFDKQAVYRIDLQNKDRRMKEMLANVSHDIRTPLTSLKGYFQLLTEEDDAEKQSGYVTVIQDKLEELTGLLDELFTYTKLQNEDYMPELVRADYTGLILETLFSFYEMFQRLGIEPRLDIADTPCEVWCDPAAVKRVAANIIRNALLHGSGQITIHYHIEGAKVCFVCENTMAAPESVDVAQVFERFYKADPARSRQSSGLGLSIAKGFVEKMGGTIEAEITGEWFVVRVVMDLCS